MKQKALDDLLSRYADELNRGGATSTARLPARAGVEPELEPLIAVMQQVKGSLVPVEPSLRFKEALGEKLIVAWRDQKRRERVQSAQRKEFFLRAAAVGSFVSLATLIAMAARLRRGTPARAQ
ncbi:MAG: hypothetical protein M1343_07540 [Chloroflexi bacterium]|nr:hypothetical protein [Chloroflexota bacterium]MDA8187275.1 hypothetical protein [Dehalococcoidales bacterium]